MSLNSLCCEICCVLYLTGFSVGILYYIDFVYW